MKKKHPVKALSFAVFAVMLTVILAQSCRQSADSNTAATQIPDGRTLAKKYCVSCHQFPEPSLLDKKSWENGVLPAMAKQLRIQDYMGQYFADKNSTLSTAEWVKIVDWYKSKAPDSLIIPKPAVAPLSDWAGFKVERPKQVNQQMPAMTTLLAINPADHQLYSADAANNFYGWDAKLKPYLIHRFDSPVTGLNFAAPDPQQGIFTCIGQMMPVDSSKGKIYLMGLKGNQNEKAVTITDSLPRPVQTVQADFNKDGLQDYVVCGFGHDRGGLYYIEQQPDHHFKKKVMRGIPGGTQLISGDFNNDGWTDVICLFAQADEGVWMYLNDHKGGFTERNLLHFPPVYGSGSIQLVDFNHDGKLDILYAAGDNSDYSKVLKPYHGVYIFQNQGNWKFKQSYFYHIDGCTKAMAADFDDDGDLDIAAIAFFTDFKYHPAEGFTYLEQTGPGKFTVHQIPVYKYGRWIVMEVNDVDGDGDPDIVLGNFSIGQRGLLNQKGFEPQWNMHEPLILLRNQHKK